LKPGPSPTNTTSVSGSPPRHGRVRVSCEPAARAGADLRRDRLERRPALGDGHAGPRSRSAAAWTAADAARGGRRDPAALDEDLGDLDGVRRGALAEVVGHDPEGEPAAPSIDASWRTRPTKMSSDPAASVASG
jgi:hypothetical protein